MMTMRKHTLLIALFPLLITGLLLPKQSPAQVEPEQRSERFVSVGVLRSHGTSPSGTARYALFDQQGSIAAYVAAKRDMDLSPYLGREIAVTAKAVSFGSGKTPFILAEQVTALANSKPADAQLASWDGPVPGPELGEVLPVQTPFVEAEPLVPYSVGPGPQPQLPVVPGHCPHCGHQCSQPVCGEGGCVACPCGPPHRIWIRPEYLHWWAEGMNIPPLVTTSNMTGTGAGALGVPGTQILYGNQEILDGSRSGFRLRGGWWLDPCQWWGIEGEWFLLGDQSERFQVSSDAAGNPVLARPFFNINPIDESGQFDGPAREDAQLVSLQNQLAGTVIVDADTSLSGLGLRGRLNVCCENYSCGDHCGAGPVGSSRIDVLVGYRFLRLRDSLDISENLVDLDPPDGVETINEAIADSFRTLNEFHGPEVGILWETHRQRWYLELLTKVAVGNNQQTVQITGSTTRTVNGVAAPPLEGGLLAQSTNIGTFERDELSVIPELGATVGYHLTPRLMATLGYSFIYWTPVVRAGDQIDRDVNPALLPPAIDPLTGAARPRFAFQETDFWVHGLSAGVDFRW